MPQNLPANSKHVRFEILTNFGSQPSDTSFNFPDSNAVALGAPFASGKIHVL